MQILNRTSLGGNRTILIFPAFCLTRFGGDILTTNNIRDKYAYYMVIYRYRGYQVGLP